jgi:hypothetical protein
MEMRERTAAASPRTYARIAGFLYLIVIVAGIFAEILVRGRLVVSGDAAATAHNILAHEQLFRWGFAAELIAGLCVVPLVLLLYELFKVVDRRVALLAVFFSLIGGAIEGAALLGHFAPLILLKRGHDLGVSLELLQALTYMALQLQGIGYAVALAFFGGTMLARGYLIFRSSFFPRIIGVLLAIEGVCYLANSFADFLAPGIAPTVFAFLMVSGLAEVVLCLWLLVMGVNEQRWKEQAAEAADWRSERATLHSPAG